MKLNSRRIISLLMLFVAITGLLVSFGENVLCAGELPGAHDLASASAGHEPAQLHDSGCPCTPSSSDSPDDHFCAGDCGCPCQAPLSSANFVLDYSPLSASLHHAEVTLHIPEVYLSLFVPPDSATI